MRRALLVLAALALVAAALQAPAARADAVTAVIAGPTAVAPSSVHAYEIAVSGGPASETNGTFTIYYAVQGDNVAGADPTSLRMQANTKGRFAVNVTAPSAEGTVQLYVKAISSSNVTTNQTTETRLSITVSLPVELRASLQNLGAAAVTNVTVEFYVDGALVGNTTVARISAGGQVDVNITYIPVGLADGQHTVKITADLDHDGVIEPERGELIQTSFFYKSEHSIVPALLGTITVAILVLLTFVLLAIRRQRRLG